MNLVFYGDSITSGENNNYISYVNYIEQAVLVDDSTTTVKNFGVSGSTFGDYSIYPVMHGSALDIIDATAEHIKCADYVFLEYGVNDSASAMTNYADLAKIVMSIVKCQDFIHQLNPGCKIVFISFGGSLLNLIAYGQEEYLKNYYLRSVEPFFKNLSYHDFISTYKIISEAASRVFDITLDIDVSGFSKELLDSDNMHPNDDGYQTLAKTILNEIKLKTNIISGRKL